MTGTGWAMLLICYALPPSIALILTATVAQYFDHKED